MPTVSMKPEHADAGADLAREALIAFGGEVLGAVLSLLCAVNGICSAYAKEPTKAIENAIAVLANAEVMDASPLARMIRQYVSERTAGERD